MIWILFDLYFKNSLQDSPPQKKNRQSEKQMQAEEMKTSSACILCVFVFFSAGAGHYRGQSGSLSKDCHFAEELPVPSNYRNLIHEIKINIAYPQFF